MKYLVKLNSYQDNVSGFADPNVAVAEFLMTEKRIDLNKVREYMCQRAKKNKPKKAARPVLCVETGTVYPSIHAAKIAYGERVGNALKNGVTAYGYHWEYAK